MQPRESRRTVRAVNDSSPPPPDSGRAADEAENVRFRRAHPVGWWLTLVGPPLATVALLLVLVQVRGADFVWQLLGTALATFFFFGRFVILGGSDAGIDAAHRFLSSGELFLMVFWMDMVVASVLAFHLGFMYRIPFLGPRIAALEQDGEFILHANRWMRRATFFGLIAFVAFPLAATGSVGGAIFGRLLGMSRAATFFGVVLGSLLGCGAMYLGAELIGLRIDGDNPWLVGGGIAVIAGLILLLNHRYSAMKKRYLDTRGRAPQ
jgi:hypothetical protein